VISYLGLLSRAAIDHQPKPIDPPRSAADDPEQTLLTALDQAPADGLSVPELIDLTSMRRTWFYDRLQTHTAAGRARKVARGRWRA
jgi:DNA segregation ATPase FtsK/SpoIIIE, S-DNA-T family